MKKKIVLISLMVVMLVCLFAVSISARTDYRQEQTYNYYDQSGNLLYSATTKYAHDSEPSYAGTFRYEMIIRESGEGFAKYDENGNPLTWYVVSDDAKDQKFGNNSQENDGVINIVVASALTTDASVGTISNGKYTYVNGMAAKVVSANFFGTGVKTFNDGTFYANASVAPSSSSEYTKLTDGSYLLCLYLPETLTSIPNNFCKRSPVRILEFENSKVSFNGEWRQSAFQFCANLKKIVIPEGITKLPAEAFRECLSLSYVKISNTVTRIENDAFRRVSGIETLIMGENVVYCGFLTDEIGRFHIEDNKNECVKMKYIYISPKINVACKFDSYRQGNGGVVGPYKNVVFFFPGDLDTATLFAKTYASDSLKVTVDKSLATKYGMTYNEPISYATYMANKEYYDTQITHHLLVYDVPYCDMFYNGQHDIESTNTYKDLLTSFKIGEVCKNCGEGEIIEYAPAFTFLGFSARIGGSQIALGYKVDQKTLSIFPEVSYGILATVPGANADLNALEPLNPDLTINGEDYVITTPVDTKYSNFNIIINSFDSAHYETPFVMCVYVADGEKVDYFSHNELNQMVQSEYAKAFTYKYIAEEFAPKHQITFSCDSNMGTLSGNLSQIVTDGANTTEVTATAKDGYTFVCWSNGSKEPTLVFAPEKSENVTAYFTHNSTGFPVMEINTDGGANITTKEYYIGCEITLLDTETGKSIGGEFAEIKGRGNSTWDTFDKKPYKFKFENKQNLFGYGKEKTWVLLADARDYSLIRNMLAYNTALSLSELEYTSKGQHVELYLNGEYRGVYYLCEQIQVKENRVNITGEDDGIAPEDVGYLVEMDAWASDGKNQSGIPNYTKDGDVFVTISGGQKPFVIKDPEDVFFTNDMFDAEKAAPYLAYIRDYLQKCHNAMYASKTEENYDRVCELIDVKSFAQAYIIFDLFKNPDVNYSSVYYYKDAGGKLVCSPVWDFDMSVGNVTHKENNTGWQIFSDTTRLWTKERNNWFNQLLQFPQFAELVGQELHANAEAIRETIKANLDYARAHKDAYEKNFTKWNLIGNTSASNQMGAWSVPELFKSYTTWEEHLVYIEDYLEASLTYLLEVYPAPSAE